MQPQGEQPQGDQQRSEPASSDRGTQQAEAVELQNGQLAESYGVGGCDPSTGTLPAKASPVVYPTVCLPCTSVSHQQQQQQQQQHDEHQESNQPVGTQLTQIDEQVGGSTPATAHYSLAPVVESFSIAADDSEDSDSNASHGAVEADDAYWWDVLHGAEGSGSQQAGEQQPHTPADEGWRPAKRHRPG